MPKRITDPGPAAGGRLHTMQWLDTAAAAQRLDIDTRTLYRLIDDGLIAAFRFERMIRLRVEDVDAAADDTQRLLARLA